MKLDIIVRTHSLGNVHKEQRLGTDSKEEILLKCVYSLIQSINQVTGHDIIVTVIDDHSSESCIAKLTKILSELKYPSKLIHLEGRGNNASMKACYEFARDNAREVIYFAEDDYLHFPSAVSEMIEEFNKFKNNLGNEVGIIPNDDPDTYKPDWIKPSRIVLGSHRHWRTNYTSNGIFMISVITLKKYWDIFWKFTDYALSPEIHEGTTVDRIWNGGVILFTPIPALAIHMHHNFRIAPYIHVKPLWDSIDITKL